MLPFVPNTRNTSEKSGFRIKKGASEPASPELRIAPGDSLVKASDKAGSFSWRAVWESDPVRQLSKSPPLRPAERLRGIRSEDAWCNTVSESDANKSGRLEVRPGCSRDPL